MILSKPTEKTKMNTGRLFASSRQPTKKTIKQHFHDIVGKCSPTWKRRMKRCLQNVRAQVETCHLQVVIPPIRLMAGGCNVRHALRTESSMDNKSIDNHATAPKL